MSLRTFRDIKRRKTKEISVGNVKIGGDNPISVQSMTNTLTTDIKATTNQINSLAEEGADLVRVSCPNKEIRNIVFPFQGANIGFNLTNRTIHYSVLANFKLGTSSRSGG